jgi:hypothetical protein
MRRPTMVMAVMSMLTTSGGSSPDDNGGTDGARVNVDTPDEVQLLVGGDL